MEMDRFNQNSIILYEDNQSTIKMLQNDRISQRSKHIDIKYFYVKDAIINEHIDIQYCSTKDMLADLMTKPLQNNVFQKHCKNLNFSTL